MVAVRVVEADPRLPHQLVITVDHHSRTLVSCNCRKRRNRAVFGALLPGGSAWEIYQRGPHDLRDGPLDRLVTGKRVDYQLT